jgi:hypothetical protein
VKPQDSDTPQDLQSAPQDFIGAPQGLAKPHEERQVPKMVVAVTVLVPAAVVLAVWLSRVPASSPATWARQEVRHAAAGALLVLPAAVALGAVDGGAEGVGALLLWGIIGGVCFAAARFDSQGPELDGDTRWLIDVSCLAFAGITVFFSVVDFGYVFIPAASFLVVALRFAHLRRHRRDLRQRS